jgi:hypothetical protein
MTSVALTKAEVSVTLIRLHDLVRLIADLLKEFDSSRPVFKNFQPGIGPYGEPQLVKKISELLTKRGYPCRTQRHPDLVVGSEWALEFKIVRPFGDNGKEAENWSVNLLHPYRGSVSAIGDAFNLMGSKTDAKKAIFVIGYEHQTPLRSLDPLLESFELIARSVCQIPLGPRTEERRSDLVHPVHQVVKCIAWEIIDSPA